MIDKFKKLVKKIKIYHVVLLYFLVQPFLAMYITFEKTPFQIFGLSINVLVNFLFVFLMIIYVFRLLLRKDKNKLKKYIVVIGIYMIIFFIYCVLHYKNMMLFDDDIFDRKSYGFLMECYYTFRSYVLPLILLFTLYISNLDKKLIKSIIKLSVFIICFVIIVTNIFGVSLAAYAEYDKLVYIDGNIFHWLFFNGKDNFDLYTSKGWFSSANELSAILLMFSPIVIVDILKCKDKKEKIFSWILLIMLIITMNMLGTSTAVLGLFASLICVLIMLIFFKIIKKENFDLKKIIINYGLVLLFCIFVFVNSPFYNKNYGEFKTEFEERPVEDKDENFEEEVEKDLVEFIESHYWNYYIEKPLLDVYPVEGDKKFWLYLINRDLRLNSNYRLVKTELYDRIIERNDNKVDFWFGIGYNDRLNSEKDYFMQIYYFGIIGLILLIGPFIINIIYCGYKILRYKKKLFNLDNMIALMATCLGLVVPYLTGHVFGIVFPMNYIVLCSLFLLISVERGVNDES